MNIIKQIWNALSNVGVREGLLSGEAKRTKLLNRIAFIGSLLNLPHVFHYFDLGIEVAAWSQMATVVAFLLTMLWNHRGYLIFSRFWFLIVGNISVFLTSSYMGFESGDHLAFFLLVLLIFTLFDVKEKGKIIFLVMVTFAFIGLMEAYDHRIFGDPITSMDERTATYLGNFIIAILIGIAIALYFQSLSDKQVDEIIFAAQQELKAVFNNSFDAIFIADLNDHKIIESNARSLELFDLDRSGSFEGEKIQALMKNPYNAQGLEEINYRLINDEKWSWEREFVTRDNRIFWGSMAYTFVKYGEKQQLLLRITDITESKEFEQKLIFEKERAESATIAKAHFLNNMSHEIRTPINGVIGLAEIISAEYGENEEELNMYADLLLESGQRLLRTIGSILDLSNLETYEAEMPTSQVCLNQVLESTCKEFESQAVEKNVELKVREMDRIYYVESELSLLQKVMEHIIGNAVKFTENGEVETWIEAFAEEGSNKAFWDIKIKDTGIGMSEDFVSKKLFMKFEQESEGLDRNYEGAGLGLSLVKRIIELLKGQIFVESQQGEGSIFTVRLPGFSASRIQK
ncbi:MAG: PAS domain-containing sensor histidine kinase [Bacteroidia bacterium]|nr:PAS domain-containing sensor histidine kinase [Bacteroidia bacterium]